MASRRQKQFDRKYSSYKKTTVTEDVNFSNHSSRSSYRSEAFSDRQDSRGRSSSTEIVSGSDTRSLPVYITIQDYNPETGDEEGIALEQGQIIEVLDKKNPVRWLVRTKARPPQSGWVPGSYFETPTEYYKQRRRTRELEHEDPNMSEEQENLLKRDQVYHDLLRSEEEFVTELRQAIDDYVKVLNDPGVPDEIRNMKDKLTLNLAEIFNFHANVMLKGLQYYSDDPGKVGQTFVRLEKDFDHHVQFYKELPDTLDLLEKSPFKEFFQSLSDKAEAGAKTYPEHLQDVADRMTHYQNYFKEFVKYSSKAKTSTKSIQKALELTMSVPQRVTDLEYLNHITQYPGDVHKLGRIIRHDPFLVWDGDATEPREAYVFLFKNKMMLTRKEGGDPATFKHYASIRLDKYAVRPDHGDPDTMVFRPNELGLPSFRLRAKDDGAAEYISRAWLKDIQVEHETFGPEEGPPRKKVKSPPAISPTGSSTSLYSGVSGGSSSIDWTTTGTTLEMQGTRVTRTQYGFRTLQESSAKMCLKVTGYPLPEITWYKDDVLLNEDERHTFYADEDGFFAMTIDPVQVDDTGRYTCMATNEYGQASTSAFFRVLKVEKEAAPPAFVSSLKDQECQEGETISFECEVEGWPEPELVWLVDEQPLRPSADFKLEYDGQNAKLEIRDAQPDDTGVYCVRIQNEYGTTESKGELTVIPDPDKNYVAPEFQAVIEDVECKEGDEVRFKAVITGDPTPEIQWMVNGIPITESEKVRMVSEDGICILTIKDVTRHFDGIVTCQGKNRLGAAACDARLTVIVPPAPPTFARPLEDKEALRQTKVKWITQEKCVVSFEVEVAGFPDPEVRFFLKGKELRPGDEGIEIIGGEGCYRLTIANCNIDSHDGELVCRAANEHGSAESRCRLNVEPQEDESVSAPTFIKDIEDQTVKFGQEAVFETSVRGQPNPEVTWYINGHKMDPSQPGVKIDVSSQDHKVTIDSAQYAGTVLCRAENSIGRFETKARLIVLPADKPKTAPRFSQLLSDQSETEGGTVVFETTVQGEPKPVVKFYLNGEELMESETIKIREFDGSWKLELTNITLSQTGELKCVATNSEGTAESTAKLQVNRKPFSPKFTETPKSVTVIEGEEAVFRASADAQPAPSYLWSIDGRKVRDSMEGARVEMCDGVSILRIDTSKLVLSSTISVVAENSLGVDESGARLTVEQKIVEKFEKKEELVIQKPEEAKAVDIGQVTQEIAGESTGTTTVTETVTETSTVQVTQGPVTEVVTETRIVYDEEHPDGIEATTVSTKEVAPGSTVTLEPTVTQTSKTTVYEDSSEVVKEILETAGATQTSVTESTEVAPDGTVVTTKTTTVFTSSSQEVPSETVAEETRETTTTTTAAEVKVAPVESLAMESTTTTVTEESTTQMTGVTGGAPTETAQTTQVEESLRAETTTTATEQAPTGQAPTAECRPEGQKPAGEPEPAETKPEEKKTTKTKKKLDSKTSAKAKRVAETEEEAKVEPPKVTVPLKLVQVNKGDLAHYETVIERATEVKWYHNQTEVTKTTSGVTISQDDRFEFRLSLDSNTFSSGSVKIVATNVSGSAESETQLLVTEQPKETNKPEFTDKLQDLEVTKGEPFEMDVIALNSPEFKWTLNGVPMEDGKNGVHISGEGNKSKLKVDDAQDCHSGTVTVQASNEVGTSESSAQIKVNEKATPPVISDGPSNQSIKETETAEFKCTITGYPEPSVKWTINEKVVEESTTITTTKSDNVYTLKVSDTKVDQAGAVKVTASNSAGQDSKTAELKVEPKFTKPEFKTTLLDRYAEEGTPVRFNVELDKPQPGTTVKWYLNGKELQNEGPVQVVDHGDGTYHLTLAQPTPDMSGVLKCKVENPAGSAEQTAELTVKGGKKKPTFEKQPQNHETFIDESVKFSAIVTGEPAAEVTWFLNGKKLENSEEIKVKPLQPDTGKTSIRIHKPQLEHSGTVTVKAENEAGSVEATATLKVDRKPEVPKFTSNMDDRQVNEGETIKYSTEVDGFPEPTVEWSLNGKPVSEFPNISTGMLDGKHTIEIHEITPEQSGELSCTATNAAGHKKQSVTLQVRLCGDAPTFGQNLDDRLVTEGELVLMKAKVNEVKPKPVITWYKDGKEIKKDDEHFKIKEEPDGTLELRIVEAKLEDKSRILIKAENTFGSAETSASLGVTKKRPMAKPAFQSDIAPIQICEGDSLNCKLLITGDPTPFVKWYINGQLVCETEDTEISNANGVFSLVIHGCTTDMSGKIKCVAYNKAGEVTTEGPLKVVAPIPVEFETSLCDATCREGDTLKLKAVLLGEPTPTVSWYVNGKKLEESQNIKIHAEKGTYTVTIKDITCDYSGKVVCEAVNEFGTASSEAMLLVLPRGEPPDFLEWLSNVRARAGSKIVHKVVFTGDPKPVLTWYINNKEVKDGPEYEIVTTDTTSTLTVKSFDADKHVGEIICKAENDAGEVSCTANMNTYTSEMFSESESDAQAEEALADQLSVSDHEEEIEEIQRTPTPVTAPKFIHKIKDQKAKRGHEAVFECVVPDTKGVVCKWLKDGKELELIARIRVQTRTIDGFTTNELIIEDVQPEDAGKYTCIVENQFGKDVCEASLHVLEVLEKPTQRAPEFTINLQDKSVKVQDKVVFECKVSGEPIPTCTWYNNEEVIREETNQITIQSEEGLQRLIIEKVETLHEGKISCVASNEAGTSKTEAKLAVESAAPQFTKSLQDQYVNIGDKVILSCSVKGAPQPTVEFYSESTKITTTERIKIEHDASNTHWRMVISQCTKEDFRRYKAVATNVVGSAISEAQVLTKIVAPTLEQGLKKTSVKEKEEIKMEVKVAGTEPEVKWFKDGQEVLADGTRIVAKEQDGTFALTIKDSTAADAGEYKVTVQNPAGSVESAAPAEVTTAVSLEGPKWVKELANVEVKEKQTVSMSAVLKATPETEVQWLKDGQPVVVDGYHIAVKKTAEGEHSITVSDARKEDAGTYSAKATNAVGEATTSANFAVVKEMQAPEFTEKLKSLDVKEKESATMSVTVSGEPAPTVSWFKDNQPVNIDNVQVISKDEGNGHFTLTIKDATAKDVGQYSCKATNPAGTAETEAKFAIVKEGQAPEFIEGLKPLEVKEKDTATMSVTVSGSPAPEVTWFKDGAPVNIDNVHLIAKDEGNGHFTFIIKDAKTSDIGQYSCKATNPAGSAETEAKFAVVKEGQAPEFIEGLKPLEVKEKDTATMSVTVSGSPAPEVTWFKDGAPVNIDNVHLIAKDEGSGQFTFIIKDARTSDIGQYSCKATNPAGTAQTDAKFGVVQEALAPKFSEGLQPIEVKEDETAKLSVTVEGSPAPEVTWFKDGAPVNIDNVHVVAKDEGSGQFTLTIKDARTSDVGQYSCKAVNPAGTAETDAKVGVIEDLQAPEFTDKLGKLEVEEGKEAKLDVTVVGKPEPEVQWLKDGVPVNIDNQHIVAKKDEAGHHSLIVKDVAKVDLGTYTCQAVNKAGKAETLGEINIPKYAFEKVSAEEVEPMFEQPLKEQVAAEGEEVVLTCKVNKESRPEVKFFKDGKPVDLGAHMELEVRDDGNIKLTIHKATKEDIGSYKCEAVNDVGIAKTDAPLDVKYGKAGAEEEAVFEKVEELEGLKEAPKAEEAKVAGEPEGPPEFVELLRSCTIQKSQQAVLKCRVKGNPRPTIKWTKDGKTVEMSTRIRTTFSDDGSISLTIDNATEEDAGEYKCAAENKFGSAWTEGPIIVTLEGAAVPAGEAPDFLQPVKPCVVDEGFTGILEGKVSGKPKPTIKWYKNGKEVKETDRISITSMEDGTQRLTIRNATMDDMDEYRCEASNEYGDVWSDVTLTVKKPVAQEEPEAPTFVKTLKEVHVQETETATFECQVAGKPQPGIKWFKDKTEISKSDTRYEQITEENGVSRLIIKSTEKKDEGEIRVEARNAAGVARSDAPLHVEAGKAEAAPGFEQELKACSVAEGQTAVFECKVSGEPLPTVQWFKDGQPLKEGDGIKIECLPDGTNRLTIDKTKVDDQGNYRVEATNAAGSMSSKAPLSVTPKTTLKIKKGLEDVTVNKGVKIQLTVEVEGKPKVIKWFKGTEQVTTTKTTRTEQLSESEYRLVVDQSEVSDSGSYRVVLSADSESVESSCTVTVTDTGAKEQTPTFKKGLSDQTVPKGQPLVLDIEVDGKPKDVKWYKNGEEVKPGPKAKIEDLGDGKYRLTIPDFQEEDVGKYSVVVSNDAGQAKSDCKADIGPAGVEGKPEIVSGLVPTTVVQGETATFTVKTKGPVKSVKWYKNGKELPSPKAKDLGDGTYQLEVPDAQKDDAADYKVVIGNDAGDADSSAALTVKLPKIGITKGLEDQAVPKGQDAVLQVEVNTPPKEVKWYKNGKELSGKAQVKKVDDNKYQLVIPKCDDDDVADYKVVLKDDDGNTAESSCALTVKLPKIQITKGLEDQVVPKGQDAILQVEVNTAPKEVKWYKNGKEVFGKAQVKKVDENNYQLVIPKCDDDDVADYKVVLKDVDDNTTESSCALTVKLPAEEPKFKKGLEDLTVPVGTPIRLEIETTGSPKTVKWYRNGKELPGAAASTAKISKVDDNNYILELPKSLVGDSGSYSVEIENEAGKAKSVGEIAVEDKITFIKPLKDLEVTEGEDAEFVVETNCKPRTVKWYRNGQEIVSDTRIEIRSDETKHRLIIKKTTKEDAAEYKVVLSNSCGDADSSAKLTVKKAIRGAPKILKGLEDQAVAKGDSLVFEIKVEGDEVDVKWTKGGLAIPASANAVIERIDDQTFRLTIPKTDVGDAGDYTAEAFNPAGKVKSSANAEVDEKPEITRGLEDSEISEHDDQVFRVEVSKPVRVVKWYKNGQEIKPDDRFQVKKSGPKKYELTVNRAEVDDTATYKVVLSNKAGECDSSASLTVIKPNIIKILEGLKDVDVKEGEPIPMKVKVEGIPRLVKWYKNGQEITPSDDLKLEENPATGEYSLLIPSAKKSDGAAYRVVLTGDRGDVYSGAVAHVKTEKPKEEPVAANFLSPLSDTEVEEGETLTLKCQVGGEPLPELTWFKDGVELKKDDRTTMRVALDGSATLRIRDSKKSDLGRYKVVAKNEAGVAESECSVTVVDRKEEPSAPRFIIPLRSTQTQLGSTQEFNVKVRGLPKPKLHWTIDDVTIKFDERITVEDMHDGNWCLTIKEVRAEDFGTIKCVAKNENGSDDCQAEFTKGEARPSAERELEGWPPRFNVPLWDRRIPVGDVLSIECHVDAKPHAEIEWFKDEKIVTESEVFEIRNTPDGACRLRIARFTEEFTGSYKCVAKNEYGVADTQASYSVEVHREEEVVEKKEYAPRFHPGLENKTVDGGKPLTLTCKVDAIPKANITWYKDGCPLRADGRHSMDVAPDGTCSLTIHDCEEGDEGAYRCVAQNEHGSTNTSCNVTVKVPKLEKKKEGEEPFFTKGLVDVWTDRGESLTLKCQVKGDPFPEIKWYRNGALVRNAPRTRIETAEDGTCTLTVKECSMSDEGIYRCEAENKHGKAKTQATAHVEMNLGKTEKAKVELGQAPRFIIPLEDMTVRLGSSINLECKVTGVPMPTVKWSKDGTALLEDGRFNWDNDEKSGSYRLTVRNASMSDEGTYRCVASNESGSATTKSFIRLDDGSYAMPAARIEPPRFAIRLGDARAVEGQPLTMECKVEGSPMPELTWFKDGAKVEPSDRIQLSVAPDGTARLHIPSCNMDDDGIYRIVATNPSGTAHDKGVATVKRAPRDTARPSMERDDYDRNKAPKLIDALENIRIPEGQGFTHRCKFSGEKLSIKWFKDGERVFPYGRVRITDHPDGTCELAVDGATRQDAGGYRCVAENQYGTARTTGDVSVQRGERRAPSVDTSRVGRAPGFTIPLTVKRCKEGASITFDCLPFGEPFPAIKWLKDGIEIAPDEKTKIESCPDGTQKLILSSVNFLAEGFYRCVATNAHGTASTKAELTVDGDRNAAARQLAALPEEPVECKPRIRRGLYNMVIHQGSTVEMTVCATGWPTPTVKWFKDGEEILTDGPDGRRVLFTDDRGIHHLVILNCDPSDEGDYALEATNKLGSARTEGALGVIRPRFADEERDRGGLPYPPGFVRQLKNKHVFSHMPTIFDCLVVGHPAPEVEWFHNGKRIIPGPRHKIQSCKGGSHALIITDTQEEDSGEYLAVAKNSAGTASSSAILDVTVPLLDHIKFNGEFDVTPYLTEEYGFTKINYSSLPTPPDKGPFIKEVTGHYLTLSWIPTKRAPPRYPQVTYVIEIRELPEKEWSLLDYNIPEPVCKVRNLELGKSYQFRVRAENIYGISDPSPASPPSRLMAPPQPVMDKNKKIIPLLDPYAERALSEAYAEQYACAPWFAPGVEEKRYCAEADSITIVLNVQGYPDPKIQWKFRGVDIDPNDPFNKCKVYVYGGSETHLVISGFSKSNVGQYQCVAINQYGEEQQNIFIDLATRPNFIQPLTNRTFPQGQRIKLDVRVEGNPPPDVKWMKEWRPVVESSRIKFAFEEPCTRSLIINDPMWRDSGVYSCVAVNDAGQTTSSCNVTVEEEDPETAPPLNIKLRSRSTSRRRREMIEEEIKLEESVTVGRLNGAAN